MDDQGHDTADSAEVSGTRSFLPAVEGLRACAAMGVVLTEVDFEQFDEATAFAVGLRLRERALAERLPIIIDIQTWDRPLFYAALPGSTEQTNTPCVTS